MDLQGWLRRKKPSDKGPWDSGSILSHSEDNENTKDVSDNLSAAQLNISAKEELVKQHATVAEDAVAGWEKAEREVSCLKLQLDAALKKNLALEDRVSHLDGALKECVRQLRRGREEQGRNIEETIAKRTYEFESRKSELDNQLSELRTQLEKAESEVAASIDGLRHKLEAAEKDNMSIRAELVALRKKLEVTALERDLSTQCAETSSKQCLDCIKKVAKLEAECRMLKFSTRKASSSDDHTTFNRSSAYVDSLVDSQSDYGERLQALEIDEVRLQGTFDVGLKSNIKAMVNRTAYLVEKNKRLETEKVELEMTLYESHSHLNVSQGRLQDATIRSVNLETQLMECQTQLRTSKERLKATKTDLIVLQKQLSECQNQLRASKTKLNCAETELMELQTQLIEHDDQVRTSQNQLFEREDQLKTCQGQLEEANGELVKLRVELVAREDELKRSNARREEEKELAVAASKLADCQKTIASLGRQLESLAVVDDLFVTDDKYVEVSRESPIFPSKSDLRSLPSNDCR